MADVFKHFPPGLEGRLNDELGVLVDNAFPNGYHQSTINANLNMFGRNLSRYLVDADIAHIVKLEAWIQFCNAFKAWNMEISLENERIRHQAWLNLIKALNLHP